MALSIKNISRVPHQVGIITAKGKKATVRIMARTQKPVTLQEGVTLNPEWLAHNPGVIKIFETTKVAVATVAAPSVPATATDATTNTAKTVSDADGGTQ